MLDQPSHGESCHRKARITICRFHFFKSQTGLACVSESLSDRRFFLLAGHPVKASFPGLRASILKYRKSSLSILALQTWRSPSPQQSGITQPFTTPSFWAHVISFHKVIGRQWTHWVLGKRKSISHERSQCPDVPSDGGFLLFFRCPPLLHWYQGCLKFETIGHTPYAAGLL